MAGYQGITQMVTKSVGNIETDARPQMLSSIVVTGGNTLLYGFADRLNIEVADALYGVYIIFFLVASKNSGIWQFG